MLRRVRPDAEDGAGLVSTVFGIAMVLMFLMLAAHVLVHLYATAAVSAAAYDAARLASGSDAVTPAAASAHGLDVLGGFSEKVRTFDVAVGADRVRVRVTADSPALLPVVFGRVLGTDAIDRTVTVRVERPVCPDGAVTC
jgi:hypothetical protein